MRRSFLHFVLLMVVLAGCTAPGATPTETASPTASTQTPTPESTVAVEYVVRAGTIPDDFRSVDVTLQVVFVERSGDMGRCWRDTYYGPYKPRPTPIGRPRGECHRSTPVTLDLTEIEGNRSIGRVTAPGRFDAGHALIVTNVTATYRNGTEVTGIRGASGKRAAVVDGRPHGQYHVTFSVESFQDRPYEYWFVAKSAAGSE